MYGKYDVPPGSDKCVPSDAVAQWGGRGGEREALGRLRWVGTRNASYKDNIGKR